MGSGFLSDMVCFAAPILLGEEQAGRVVQFFSSSSFVTRSQSSCSDRFDLIQ
jgi:hypothetical protein